MRFFFCHRKKMFKPCNMIWNWRKQVIEMDNAKSERMGLEFQPWCLHTAELKGCVCRLELRLLFYHPCLCLVRVQYGVGENVPRLSSVDVSDLESQPWTGGNLQPREVPPGLSRSACCDHTLPYRAVTKPEICPQFLLILLDHRDIEIIVRILQFRRVKMERLT